MICLVCHIKNRENVRKMKIVMNYEHEEETISMYMEDITDLILQYHQIVAKELDATHEANYAHE